MRFNGLIVLVIFLAVASCNVPEEKDYSLPMQEYLSLGVPDPSQTWDFDQNREANMVLGGMKWEKPYQLPRKNSPKSGQLFDRLIGLENMTFLNNDALKLHEKAYYSLEFLKLIENWKETYTNPIWKTQYYQKELVDININQVRVTQIMVDIAEEIMKSDDPVDKMMREGVPSVKQNYVSSLINALHAQKEISEFLKTDLERMTDSLAASIKRNSNWLDDPSASEIRKSVEAVTDSTSLKYVKARYRSVMDLL